MTYPQPPRGLTLDDLGLVSAQTEARLRLFNPSPTEWAQGMTWYADANLWSRSVAAEYGLDPERTAWALAALSPMNRWSQNKQDLIDVIETDESGALPLGSDRAYRILRLGADPVALVGGRKVRSFARNIAYPWHSHDVTLDSWMAELLELPLGYRYLERKGSYTAISDAFRTRADELGIYPHQLQATLWIHTRGTPN